VDPTETAGDVQPEAGAEGQGDQGLGLYDLNEAPEELRPHLEPELKKIEGNVTKKLQEAADFRKKYEAFEELGLADHSPEDVGGLLQLLDISRNDPEQFEQWWSQVGESYGFFDDDEGEEDGEEGDESEEAILERVREMLQEEMAPVKEHLSTTQQEQAVQEANAEIDKSLAALREKHGDFDEQRVMRLALTYEDADDPIREGFREYMEIRGNGQSELVKNKLDQPEPAETGGAADTSRPQVTSFGDAKRAAKERYAQAG
jgi:hypothetical protein